MSTVVSKNVQIGADGTASNNFTAYQPSTPDGTLRIGNGNSGSVTDAIVLNSSGVVSFTNNPTLSAGTANGVTYLNGSKVLTSGSALTFDGSNLSTTGQVLLENNNYIGFKNTTGTYAASIFNDTSNYLNLYNSGNTGTIFYVNAAEQMRLTSTGLGIGTTSPSGKLSVVGRSYFQPSTGTAVITLLNTSGGDGSIQVSGTSNTMNYGFNTYSTGNALYIQNDGNVGIGTSSPQRKLSIANGGPVVEIDPAGGTAGPIYFNYNRSTATYLTPEYWALAHIWNVSGGTKAMTLDSSGNLGLGVTPSAWNSSYRAFQVASHISLWGNSAGGGALILANNEVFDATNTRKYLVTDFATEYVQLSGQHQWKTAPSGTAGGTISFTQAMTLTTAGNLLVGTTAVVVNNKEALGVVALDATGPAGSFKNSAGAASAAIECWNSATTGNNIFTTFATDAYAARGTITYNRAGGLVAYNTTSDYRAKDISGPLTDSGAVIDSTPVYMGKMKGATQERPMFIAHETPAYAHTGEKDAIDKDGNPVYQQMDASALVPVMWAEIQSLRKRLADAGIA